MSGKIYTFNEGVMWENNPWFILIDQECSDLGGKPCRHCHSHNVVIHTRYDNRTWEEKKWICSRVVQVFNEGGCNTTGLCLDCLLEAIEVI